MAAAKKRTLPVPCKNCAPSMVPSTLVSPGALRPQFAITNKAAMEQVVGVGEI